VVLREAQERDHGDGAAAAGTSTTSAPSSTTRHRAACVAADVAAAVGDMECCGGDGVEGGARALWSP
jgi:hypothetical protein